MIDEGREVRGNGTSGDEQRDAPESTAAVRQELAATRERMSGTIAELEQRVAGKVDSVKQKVDVVGLVKRNPWPALAAAFVAGVALSVTGADRRAARATTRAAKRAPETAKRGASKAVRATTAGVSQLAGAAADRFKGSSDDDASTAGTGAGESGGLVSKATGALRAQARELGEEVKRGADELSDSAPPRRNSGI
jgi:type IV secretory pathway TrbL component